MFNRKRRHYFLVYRTDALHPLDIRCPVGGVSVVCGPQVSAVKLARVKVRRLFAQRPGERLPADGRVRRGSSSVNAAPVTGES